MKFVDFKSFADLQELAKSAPNLSNPGYLNEERVRTMTLSACSWKMLYGTERVDNKICKALASLAKEANVHDKMSRMQEMEVMNYVKHCESEERRVGHTAIRSQSKKGSKESLKAKEEYQAELAKLRAFLPKVASFKSMIIVGIGGSYLGTKAVYNALKALRYHRPSMAEICYGKDASQINTACLDPAVNGQDCGKSAVQKLDNSEIGASDFNQALADSQSQSCAKHRCNEKRLKAEDTNAESDQLLNSKQYKEVSQ
ncbi:MAG: hypothetical protein FJZ64_01710 [Chlamydiae bacterium]|nr:hypothetical protein [Chlamydiota bacterium]